MEEIKNFFEWSCNAHNIENSFLKNIPKTKKRCPKCMRMFRKACGFPKNFKEIKKFWKQLNLESSFGEVDKKL